MIPKPYLDWINAFFAKKEAWEQGIGKKVFIFGWGYECVGIVTAWYYEGGYKKYDVIYKSKNQTESRFGSFMSNQIYFYD